MALIAEFSFPSESFALGEPLERCPDVVVEAGRLVAHSPDATMPSLWVAGDSRSAFDEALRDDPAVREIVAREEFPEQWLYHLTWSDEVREFVADLVDHQGVVLQATGSDDRWRVRLRFVTREQFETFRSEFASTEREFQLEQLFEQEFPHQRGGTVTQGQYRALAAATRAGYFEVPRETSIEDLAADLDVSHQAVSERLRRGTANLVREQLLRGRDEDVP